MTSAYSPFFTHFAERMEDTKVSGIIPKWQMTEEDIKLHYITPALSPQWKGLMTMETQITDGRINLRGNLVSRARPKKADYILYINANHPIAIVEAKDNRHAVGDGLQQAMTYAQMMDVPFAYSTNGDAFREHDFITGQERDIPLEDFPTPQQLYARFKLGANGGKGLTPQEEAIIRQPYYSSQTTYPPRYYQRVAVNRTLDARLTRAAPAAPPFSHSFGLHPPLHASHPFIARPPSPLPGTSNPQPSAFHRMFHLEASSPRSPKASLCHAPPAPPLPEASACAAAPCPEVSRRPQLLPFFLLRLSTVCGRNIPPFSPVPAPTPVHIPPGSTPCPFSPGRLPRPCKSCTPQLCTCHVPPWAVPRAARMPRWWHDKVSTAQALPPAPILAPRGGCAPVVRTCMVHHTAHAPPPPHR